MDHMSSYFFFIHKDSPPRVLLQRRQTWHWTPNCWFLGKKKEEETNPWLHCSTTTGWRKPLTQIQRFSLAKYETRSRNLTLASISRCVHNKTNKWVKAGFKPWWWCSLTYVRVLLLWPLSWPDDLFYLCFWLCLLSDAWTAARDYNIFAPKTAPPAFAPLTFSWLSRHLKVNVQGA